MTHVDIQKDLTLCRDFLKVIKKDISSGQIRNYGNVLNGLKRLTEPLLILQNEHKDETILKACNYLEGSRSELQDIVSDSMHESASWIKVTNRLDDLIVGIDHLLKLLAETSTEKDVDKTTFSKYQKLKILLKHAVGQGWQIFTKSFWEAFFERVWPKQ